jgi:DNA-binding response OmpR family regulator
LPRKEFHLLYELVQHAGALLVRQHLLDTVWGPGYSGDPQTIDVHVGRLRRRLGDHRRIRTVWGVGYLFEVNGN